MPRACERAEQSGPFILRYPACSTGSSPIPAEVGSHPDPHYSYPLLNISTLARLYGGVGGRESEKGSGEGD